MIFFAGLDETNLKSGAREALAKGWQLFEADDIIFVIFCNYTG